MADKKKVSTEQEMEKEFRQKFESSINESLAAARDRAKNKRDLGSILLSVEPVCQAKKQDNKQ